MGKLMISSEPNPEDTRMAPHRILASGKYIVTNVREVVLADIFF